MYKFPDITQLSGLVHKRISQICIGENELILNFDGDSRLTVFSTFGVSNCGQEIQWFDSFVSGSNHVMSLLGQSISSLKIDADSNARMQVGFANGSVLHLTDEFDSYESLLINIDGRIIVV